MNFSLLAIQWLFDIIILLTFTLKSVYKASKAHPITTDCTLPQIKHIAYLFVCF